MRAIVEKVNFKRGLVTYEIDGYDYGWLEILDSVEVEPEEIIEAKGLFEYLVCDLEVNKQTVIADIGSGTGKLSQDLLKVAGIVYCVEPNDEMRQVAESLLSNQEGFISVKGTAEQTTLMDKSVDFIPPLAITSSFRA